MYKRIFCNRVFVHVHTLYHFSALDMLFSCCIFCIGVDNQSLRSLEKGLGPEKGDVRGLGLEKKDVKGLEKEKETVLCRQREEVQKKKETDQKRGMLVSSSKSMLRNMAALTGRKVKET